MAVGSPNSWPARCSSGCFPPWPGSVSGWPGSAALRREALEGIALADGYGVDIALLIDVYRRYGRQAIAEIDLRERLHRNRPLHELHRQARAVLDAVLTRAT